MGVVAGGAGRPAPASTPRKTRLHYSEKPLAPGRTYAVRLSAASGKAWSGAPGRSRRVDEEEAGRRGRSRLLKRLNGYRKAAGLDPVSATRTCRPPAPLTPRYLEPEFRCRRPELERRGRDPARRIARRPAHGGRALVDAGGGAESSAGSCVASFMAREMVLDAGLRKKSASGATPHAGGRLRLGDRRSGRSRRPAPAGSVLFPGPDQRACRRRTGRRRPPPSPTGRQGPLRVCGHGLVSAARRIADVEARIVDEAGRKWKPTYPLPKTGAAAPAALSSVVPESVLRPGVNTPSRSSAKVGARPVTEDTTLGIPIRPATRTRRSRVATAAVRALNAYRRTAGLSPVDARQEAARRAAGSHALSARNIDQPACRASGCMRRMRRCRGRRRRAAGPAGRRWWRNRTPGRRWTVVDTLFHRVPLLNPDLKAVGYACVRLPDRGYVCVMDAEPGKEKGFRLRFHFAPRPGIIILPRRHFAGHSHDANSGRARPGSGGLPGNRLQADGGKHPPIRVDHDHQRQPGHCLPAPTRTFHRGRSVLVPGGGRAGNPRRPTSSSPSDGPPAIALLTGSGGKEASRRTSSSRFCRRATARRRWTRSSRSTTGTAWRSITSTTLTWWNWPAGGGRRGACGPSSRWTGGPVRG